MNIKQKILKNVELDLKSIEVALKKNLKPNLKLVKNIASYLLFSGGKRLRPLLLIHSARLCNYDDNDLLIKFSTVFEYLHAATLLHDDIIDMADIRRKRKTAHKKWSTAKVVLTGDFLLARCLEITTQTKRIKLIKVVAKITNDMSQAEIEQLDKKGKLNILEKTYLNIIKRKTASLIQGACQCGAIIAHNKSSAKRKLIKKEKALKKYGFHLGMAFQMIDDILDYTAEKKILGKNPGTDMAEKKLTLPVIHALAYANNADKKWIENVFTKNLSDENFDFKVFEKLKEKLYSYNSIKYAENKARNHIKKAKAQLKIFNNCKSKKVLCQIANYCLQRKL